MSEVKHLEINYKTDELFELLENSVTKIYTWLKNYKAK